MPTILRLILELKISLVAACVCERDLVPPKAITDRQRFALIASWSSQVVLCFIVTGILPWPNDVLGTKFAVFISGDSRVHIFLNDFHIPGRDVRHGLGFIE